MAEMKMTLNFVLCLMFSVGSAQDLLQLDTVELSMMNQCIDDMFSNCMEKMATQVQKVYFPREIQISPFKEAWNEFDPCALKKLKTLQTKYNQLTISHTKAVCAYTFEYPNLYGPLNTALRTGAPYYNTTAFQYHALYFWLTSALQILKGPCQTTYRRTKVVQNGKKGDIIRFGYFASSSTSTDLTGFGSETCFHIKTWLGVYIGDFSIITKEKEVLIPPYEMFKIIKIEANTYGGLKCNKIFVLESVGFKSNLDCKAVNHNQEIRANFILIHGFQILIGLLWTCF